MNLIKALQLRALRNVYLDDEDPQYQFRKIFRWYSSHFHTPLHIVQTLPLIEVLEAYIESRYEEMGPDELEAERTRLTETDEEKAAREKAEAEELDDADRYAQEAGKKELDRLARIAAKRQGNVTASQGQNGDQLIVESMGGGQGRVVPADELANAAAIVTEVEDTPIVMKFDDVAAFDEMLEGFGNMAPPEKLR